MNRSPGRYGNCGMTMTELVVVSFILIVLSGISFAMARYQSQTFRRETGKAMTQGDLRIWLARMANEIRKANYDPRGVNKTTPTFTVKTFTPTQFTFTTDANSNGALVPTDAAENMGYRLSGGSLQLWQSGTTWRTVLTGVTSLLFEYKDGKDDAITGTTMSDRQAISSVKITLRAQPATRGSPDMPPPVIEEKITATLRNPAY